MTTESKSYCECGTPQIDGSLCSKCGNQIQPRRLRLLLAAKRREKPEPQHSDDDDDDDDDIYEYKHSLNKSIREGGVPLYTTFDIPGKQVVESLGMISGVGNAMFTLTGTSARLTNRATTKALNQLLEEARRIEADAVVGVSLALDSFGTAWVQQLAVFTGTAVKLKK